VGGKGKAFMKRRGDDGSVPHGENEKEKKERRKKCRQGEKGVLGGNPFCTH